MDITYLGHSSFRLKGKNASLVTDPYDSQMVGLKYPSVEADIVTVSHDHKDHNQTQLVKGVKKVVAGPGEYEIQGISIIGIPSYHDSEKGQQRGKNVIYVYEVDGIRLAHLGDLGHTLNEGMIEQIGDIDVLFVPVGGSEYNLSSKKAVEVMQAIEPYFVIPMHYKMAESKNSTLNLSSVEDFLAEAGITVEKLPKFSLKKEDIIKEQNTKIVLLSLK
jgi:L-ascorbate metabolism protein UlaG (beta-lactamase superfamily)